MKVIFYCLLLVVYCSCNSPAPVSSQPNIEQLADNTCKAIKIRKARFALADSIKLTTNVLEHSKNTKAALQLQHKLKLYAGQKDQLLKQSLELADTIRNQLDVLLPLTDKAAQNQFTKSLDSLLILKGCKDKKY